MTMITEQLKTPPGKWRLEEYVKDRWYFCRLIAPDGTVATEHFCDTPRKGDDVEFPQRWAVEFVAMANAGIAVQEEAPFVLPVESVLDGEAINDANGNIVALVYGGRGNEFIVNALNATGTIAQVKGERDTALAVLAALDVGPRSVEEVEIDLAKLEAIYAGDFGDALEGRLQAELEAAKIVARIERPLRTKNERLSLLMPHGLD